tara:strand:+ start:106 stop:621 length:516 start_codon:yes stop_codon:yes gene_type:complete
MSQKNNKIKRSFIPQPIGDTLKKINRNFSSKFGKVEFIIQSKWSEIAGSYFAEYSEPLNISRSPIDVNDEGETIYKNILNVSVSSAAALEFQHFKDKILEKINSYFGYKAIIDLRIQQNYIPISMGKVKINDKNLTKNEKLKISNEVQDMSNKDLQESLIDLGKNILKESK